MLREPLKPNSGLHTHALPAIEEVIDFRNAFHQYRLDIAPALGFFAQPLPGELFH